MDGLDLRDGRMHRVSSPHTNNAAGRADTRRNKCYENNAWRRNMNRSNLDFSPYRILAVAATVCLAPIWIPLALYIALTYSWEDTVPATEDL